MGDVGRRYRIETSRSWPAVAPAAISEDASPDPAGLAETLRAMRSAIVTTKREIADLAQSPSGASGMHRAACELDAVTLATEEAATTILGAVEDIERAANGARADGPESMDVVLDRVRILYEACNFQDISGQRIRKVVKTLKFVEARIDMLISIWGADAPTGGPPTCGTTLAGPALPGAAGHVSQADVDAFFA